VDLGQYSEPEPDILLLRPQATEYGQTHPDAQYVLLLIEVADISLAYDQGIKRDPYARNGVREYWVVDVAGICHLSARTIAALFAQSRAAIR
jgi:Uma2 family endonuclease